MPSEFWCLTEQKQRLQPSFNSSFSHLQLFVKARQLALSTPSERLEEPMKMDDRRLKRLGRLCALLSCPLSSSSTFLFILPVD